MRASQIEAVESLKTIRDCMRYGASLFRASGLYFGHGTDNAFDEAAWLVLDRLHLPLDLPESWWDSRLARWERQRVLERLQERVVTRKPAAYLTGEAWFMGLPFFVDSRVLVPRSPIAQLLEQELSPWVDPEGVARILDLGTGSGCIGIAAASVFPDAEVWLSDISPDALCVARSNRLRHGLEDRVHLVQSDVFAGMDRDLRFDVILSNPPYVDSRDLADMPDEFRHEPVRGLAAGEDGLDIVRQILRDARAFLAARGVLIVEVGNSQAAVEEAFPDIPFTWLDFAEGGAGVFLLRAEQLP